MSKSCATSTLLCLAATVIAATSALALTFPALPGRVVDEAGLPDPATKVELERKLADFETRITAQLVVVTLKSLKRTSINKYDCQLGNYWQIGQKDKNNGVLLLVAPNERNVRIEVACWLRGTLTDTLAKAIIEAAIGG